MSRRFVPLALPMLFTLSLSASLASADWAPDGTTIKATTASIPLIAACSDGGSGTFVVWQEQPTSAPAVLRIQHVLSTGGLDPTWPIDGALACGVSAGRSEIGAIPDHFGGAYLWWKEGLELFVSRIAADAGIATGWPARGRSLGLVMNDSPRPSVIEDGQHGIYLAWAAAATTYTYPAAIHLGPDNTGAGGWPNLTRAIAPIGQWPVYAEWSSITLAPDGGLFTAWVTFESPDGQQTMPGFWWIKRLTSAGLTSSGWPGDGIQLEEFHREYLGNSAKGSLLALAPDQRGGFLLFTGNPVGPVNETPIDRRVRRFQGDGQPAAGWPLAGVEVPEPATWGYYSAASNSYRLIPDGNDGAHVGAAADEYTDSPTMFVYRPLASDGSFQSIEVEGVVSHEAVLDPNGDLFLAHFKADGPQSPWDWNAFYEVSCRGIGALYGEYHSQAGVHWFGDVALAPATPSGVVLFWSQAHDKFGLFARRFNRPGQVTSVPASGPARFALEAARFVPGVGVRVLAATPGAGSARLELFDLGGRRAAGDAFEAGATPSERTLPGTRDLASGIYWVRLTTREGARVARVAVAR